MRTLQRTLPKTVRFSLELPTQRIDAAEEFLTAAAVAEIAREAETVGFAALHVTDHPAPDAKWLDRGGHHALDPFVALSFAAAATSRIKVLTNAYIAAYRNPFLGAKSIQSLDVLSGHRLILGTAAGYLKPEFRSLGVSFDHRADLLDDALEVLRALYAGDDVAREGSTYSARGVRLRPLRPDGSHPPIWIGGNSRAAARRAVERHQGWAPFNTFGYATASRTVEIDSVESLAAAVAWARDYAAQIGRTAPLDICFSAGNLLDDDLSVDRRHDIIGRLTDAGVTWLTIAPGGADRAEVLDNARLFAKNFIATANG